MDGWLRDALAYVPRWLDYQMRRTEQVGCLLAVAHRGETVLEEAFGLADLATGEPLTPRHRFRVASHSKTFTAAGIMRLREQERLRLDDPIGRFVTGLHPEVAETTIAQLLSHSAGLTRDGDAGGQFADRIPFASTAEVLEDIAGPPLIDPNTRFKYSNHGYALLGMAISAVTGEPYRRWIRREVVEAFGLRETEPDMPLPPGTPFARGHTMLRPLERRLTIPGDYETNAVGSAAGFVSTAADLTRFFGQLSPKAEASPLSVSSRREMTRGQWTNPHASVELRYGLGTMSGRLGGWSWFGHSGGLLGYISRTCVVPEQNLAASLLVNGADALTWPWVDGILQILRAWETRGAAADDLANWTGRWWNPWGCVDLVPQGNRVIVAMPGLLNPLADAQEIEVTGPDRGVIVAADGFGNYREPVRLVRNEAGEVAEFWIGGTRMTPEGVFKAELAARYNPAPPSRQAESGQES
ncbi:MAG: beta-lactamase family protein [Proteobacteria bacterium]|nr:beta-lactamase family protein [Pseudomonadota bacterium]